MVKKRTFLAIFYQHFSGVNITNANIVLPNEEYAGKSFKEPGYMWKGDASTEDFPIFRRKSVATFGVNELSNFQGEKLESPLAFWKLFFDDKIIKKIVAYTNKFGKSELKDRWKDTDATEIEGFFGLIYAIGIDHKTKLCVDDLFSSIVGLQSFYAPLTFSRNRYQLLLRCLRFDDAVERKKKPKSERLAMDPIIEPCKYGIKIWAANDLENFYLFDAKIYAGHDKEDAVVEKKLAEKVVLHLTKYLVKAGRTITCDNFFTSLALADYLYDKSTYIVGTIRATRKGLPGFLAKNKMVNRPAADG
uniref:PiggyBac transposable element-derived protein domain-containing protein n=1 Tax=Romanomermis culicivorax TaxID=13658 RepID=A0A915K1H2_ROMCU